MTRGKTFYYFPELRWLEKLTTHIFFKNTSSRSLLCLFGLAGWLGTHPRPRLRHRPFRGKRVPLPQREPHL